MQLQSRIRRFLLKDDDASWREHRSRVRSIEQWIRALEVQGDPSNESGGDTTAIVLNYKRPHNIDAIVRSLLQTPSIKTVIVSNNNPACNIRRWLDIANDRIRIIDQPVRCSTAERYRIAALCDTQYFLAVDDDLFLLPEQYEKVMCALKADPSRVHGVFGQTMQQDGTFQYAVRGDTDLDVCNRVYAFTREHVMQFHALVERLHLHGDDWKRSDWDDIVISFSGAQKPRSHVIGPYLDCPTQGKKGIAVWRRDDFFDERLPLFRRLQLITRESTMP